MRTSSMTGPAAVPEQLRGAGDGDVVCLRSGSAFRRHVGPPHRRARSGGKRSQRPARTAGCWRWWGACLAACTAILLAAAAADAATWSSVRSAHVMVLGDAPATRLREVAFQFERFREALERQLPNTQLLDTVPTMVVVLDSDRAMRSFKPVRDGKVVDSVGGLVLPADDVNYLMFSTQSDEAALQLVLGGYATLLLRATIPGAPFWITNGLGHFYSTFSLAADGKSASAGSPPKQLLTRARDRLIPVETVIAAGYNSSLYRDEDEREVFDGVCWALVHYIVSAIPDGASGLATYLGMTMRGVPAVQAFKDAFHLEPAELTATLRQHVSRPLLPSSPVALGERPATTRPERVEVLTEAQTQARMADIFVSQSRDAQAEQALAQAMSATPPPAQAFLARGRLRLRQRRVVEGWPDVLRAADESRDDYVTQFQLGSIALGLAGGRVTDADRPRLEAGRRALDRALELQPETAEALYAKARTLALLGVDLDAAREAAGQAAELGPGREEYRLLLAQIALAQHDTAAARDALGTLAARASRLEVVQRARALMADVAKLENAAAPPSAADRADASRGERADNTAASPGSGADPADAPPAIPGATRGGGYELMLRPTASAEQRALGTVTSIDCGALGTLFYTRLEDRSVRLFARALEAVEFITYRDNLGGSVACGPQRTLDHVFVTWRPASSATSQMGRAYDGEIVAVEMLPRDYTP